MVDISALTSLQGEAKSLATKLGYSVQSLDDTELRRFGKSFERHFVLAYAQRPIIQMYLRHEGEALLGAMIAKEQMNSVIDGEQPASGKIAGPLPIRAAYFGIGDDWEDLLGIYAGAQGFWTPGAPQDWIHAGTTMMGGAAGNAIRIGENATHVVFGLGSLHATPMIESTQFTINAKTKPIFLNFFAQKQVLSRHWKEFDNAYIFKKDDTVLAQTFISGAFGAAITEAVDFPYLIGVSYIKEPQARVFDPPDLDGTVNDVVLAT